MYIRLRNLRVWLNKKKQLKYKRKMTTLISALQMTQIATMKNLVKKNSGKSTSR